MNCHPLGCPKEPVDDCWTELIRRLNRRGYDVRPEIYQDVMGDTLEAVVSASRAGRIKGELWPYAQRVVSNILADHYAKDRMKRESEVADLPGESIPALPKEVYVDELQRAVAEFFTMRLRTVRVTALGFKLARVLDDLPEQSDAWTVIELRRHIKTELATLKRCKPDSINRLIHRALQETGGRTAFEAWHNSLRSHLAW